MKQHKRAKSWRSWTRTPGKRHSGHKLHASVDKRYKCIRKVVVSDRAVLEVLPDPANTSRDGYADRGYPSIEWEATLKLAGNP